MFCQECGHKNENEAKYCENCGAKILEAKEPKIIAPKKQMPKKKKILVGTIISVIAILVIIFIVLSNMYNPKTIALKYFKAYITQSDSLYKYLDTENSGLTSKKIFNKVVSSEKNEILNYSVVDVTEASDGLSATVKISYTLKGSSSSKTETIYLLKDKKNKFFFFDNWYIGDTSSLIVNEVYLRTIKDSQVKLDGVTVSSKYLDKTNESEYYDSYIIPEMFKGNYDAVITLKNGLSLDSTVTVGNSKTVNLTTVSVSDSVKSKLEGDLPKTVQNLYSYAMNKKSFDDIKSNYNYKGADLSTLEEEYESFAKSISNYDLKQFEVTSLALKNVSLDKEGYLTVSANVKYKYEIKYTLFGEEKTKSKETSDIMYFTFDYADDEFKLIGMESMATYFSKY